MTDKFLSVACPCCKATLEVDAATGAVLKHLEFKREVESLESFMEKQKNKSAELDARFAMAKEKEKQKMELLDKKFRLAQERGINDDPKEGVPGIQWD